VVSAKEDCALAVSSTSNVGSHFIGRQPLFTVALTLHPGILEHSEVPIISASSANSQACGTIENRVEVRALPQAQFQLGHDPAKLLR
jgi:hypothetical protein